MTSQHFKKSRRLLCPGHRVSVKAFGGWRRAFVIGLSVAVLTPLGLRDARANTADNVTGTAANTPLDSGAGYSGGLPGATNDVTFTSGTAYSGSFTLNTAPLSIGTLDDLNATALTISASQSITLNGGGNSVAPSTSDLFYVASGGNLTLFGTGGLVLASGGNFDIVGTAAIGSNITGSQNINKTGAGTLVLAGTNAFTGTTQSVNGASVLVSTVLNAGTIQVQSNSALGTGYFKFENTNTTMSLQAGTNGLTIANNLVVNENNTKATVDNNGYSSFTLSGAIINNTSGTENSQNLNFTGSGTTFVTGTASQFTGRSYFNAGTVNVASIANTGVASSLGTRGTTIDANAPGLIFQGGTLQYTGSTAQTTNRLLGIAANSSGTIDASGATAAATLSFTKDFTTSGANLFVNGGGRTLILTGTNTGNNSFGITLYDQASNGTNLVKNGTGNWIYAGNANGTLYNGTNGTGANSGTITVNTGTLAVTGNNSSRTGATTVAANATLQLQANAANTSGGISTALSTSASLAVNSGSTIQLRGDSSVSFAGTNFSGLNNYTLNFDVNQLTAAGTGNTLSLASGGIATGGGFGQVDTINVTGGNGYTLGLGSISVNAAQSLTLNPTTGNLSIAALTNSTNNITKNGAGTATIGSNTTNQTGSVNVNAGTLVFSGANNYTGATTITGGTLLVNGSTTTGSAVSVTNTGSVLGGTGTVGGVVTVNSGARLLGGAGTAATGVLTLTSTPVLNSGSIIELVLGTANTHSTLTLSAGGFNGFNGNQAFTLDNIQAGTYDNVITGVASGITTTGWTITNGAGAIYSFTDDGTNIDLTITAVPEPSTYVVGVLLIGALGWRQRRSLRALFAA